MHDSGYSSAPLTEAEPSASKPVRPGSRDTIDYEQRHFVNLCATAFLLALALCIGWTVKMFDQQQRMERCLMSGRKDCIEIGRVTRGMVQLTPIVSR